MTLALLVYSANGYFGLAIVGLSGNPTVEIDRIVFVSILVSASSLNFICNRPLAAMTVLVAGSFPSEFVEELNAPLSPLGLLG